MSKIIAVTGCHRKANAIDSISHLSQYLQVYANRELDITEFLYHYNTIVANQDDLQYDGRLLKSLSSKDSIVFAHSRGALVVYEAVRLGAKFGTIILFGAAMEKNWGWPQDCANKIINIYNPRDLLLKLGSLLPNQFFGTLGSKGHKGIKDKRIVQYDANMFHKRKSWINPHSDYFLSDNLPIWGMMLLNEYRKLDKLEKIKC